MDVVHVDVGRQHINISASLRKRLLQRGTHASETDTQQED